MVPSSNFEAFSDCVFRAVICVQGICDLVVMLRFQDKVLPAGGADEYLSSVYPTKALLHPGAIFLLKLGGPVVCTCQLSCQSKQLEFAQFIDEFCPADGKLVSKIFFIHFV